MVPALVAMGLSEEEIIEVVMETFTCDRGEALFIIDIELGNEDGDCVLPDEDVDEDDA